MEAYLGQVIQFAGNFAPRGWMQCQGQLMSISQNAALFSILGNNYGGDGRVTFGLPDLRGRTIVGQGQGTNLSPYEVGEQGGVERITLLQSEMPAHTHTITLQANGDGSDRADPTNAFLAIAANNLYASGTSGNQMAMQVMGTSVVGSGVPTPILDPYLALTSIVATEGIFPTRN